ncbi:MAG: response regulator [Bradymonadales bacterium]|nr:MAG: response regulator [Bradymonadales bacterium]
MNKPQVHSEESPFRILIVDDDLSILNLLRELIEMVPGCVVLTASKPDDAMKIIAQEPVDVVFTDIHMPGVTGLEMLEDIFSLDQIPEVVVMTAYPSGEIAQKAMELGVNSLLAKPFEDISLVEIELGKAIKRILRKKPAASKPSSSKGLPQEEDQDPELRLSLDPEAGADLVELGQEKKHSPEAPAKEPEPEHEPSASPTPVLKGPANEAPIATEKLEPSTDVKQEEQAWSRVVESGSEKKSESEDSLTQAPLFSGDLLEKFVRAEIPRAIRYKRAFVLGLVDIPENLQAKSIQERKKFRAERLRDLRGVLRASDLLFDLGREGMAFLAFECNRAGSQVIRFKLSQAGFEFLGLSVYPAEAVDLEGLLDKARQDLQEKRKQKILLLESEEFFGRIVQNMLTDPKYHVTWIRSYEEAYRQLEDQAESIKLMIISLKKDSDQWALLSRLKKEKILKCPILLFTEVAVEEGLRNKLHSLGVKGIVKKGASQEEFSYVVQSFVMHHTVPLLRKNPRALSTLPVVYRHQGNEVSSNTFTLSRDGAFIRDMSPPASGEKLEIEVFIPGQKEALRCQAEVLYSVPYFVGVNRIHVPGMAVRFENLTESQIQMLDLFVSQALTGYLIGD